MAKRKASRSGAAGSISGYFKAKFAERPELLKQRSNGELYDLWLHDHPDHREVPLNVKQGLSNIKSSMRRKRKRRGRPARAKVAAGANGVAPKAARVPFTVLEKLEVNIDGCLMLARSVDAEGLEDVIRELRKARNDIVLKQRP